MIVHPFANEPDTSLFHNGIQIWDNSCILGVVLFFKITLPLWKIAESTTYYL